MRPIAGAVVALLLTALPAPAGNDGGDPRAGATAMPPAPSTGSRNNRQARAPAQVPAPAPPTDAGAGRFAAARKRAPAPPRDALPLAERVAIQFDLAWSGDYNGLVDGEPNEKTTAAIKAFQRDRKFKETGVLSTQERALLAAEAKTKQAQVGWRMVDDPVSGARIGLPTKQVPNKSRSRTGTRWSSAQGQIQVETFKIRGPGTTLTAVYEQQKKEPPTRRLEVDLLRPDFFILSGMQNLKRFYVRAEIKDGEVRGMGLLYDQATEPIMDPVVVVMSSVFVPFPGAAGFAGIAQIGPQERRKVEYGTGIVVSAAGHILTDRQVTDGCNVIVVGGYGDAEWQAQDKGADLALLRVYGTPALVPAGFGGDAPQGPLMLVGIADPQDQEGGGAISTAAATLEGGALEPAPRPGFSGGAALDRQGRFVGMVGLKPSMMTAAIGAASAQSQATLVPAPIIRAFLEAQGLAPAAPGRGSPDAAKASLVRVICVRK